MVANSASCWATVLSRYGKAVLVRSGCCVRNLKGNELAFAFELQCRKSSNDINGQTRSRYLDVERDALLFPIAKLPTRTSLTNVRAEFH